MVITEPDIFSFSSLLSQISWKHGVSKDSSWVEIEVVASETKIIETKEIKNNFDIFPGFGWDVGEKFPSGNSWWLKKKNKRIFEWKFFFFCSVLCIFNLL